MKRSFLSAADLRAIPKPVVIMVIVKVLVV